MPPQDGAGGPTKGRLPKWSSFAVNSDLPDVFPSGYKVAAGWGLAAAALFWLLSPIPAALIVALIGNLVGPSLQEIGVLAALLAVLSRSLSLPVSVGALVAAYIIFKIKTARYPDLPPPKQFKKVAIIGAGASGIVSVKSMVEEGHEPVVFEKAPGIGGVWRYDAESTDYGGVWKTAIATSSALIMAFSDFPVPKDAPYAWKGYQNGDFFTHEEYTDYLKRYIANFQLADYFRFGTVVEKVQPLAGDRWRVQVRNVGTGEVKSDEFDAVLLCSGLNHIPSYPKIEDQDKFKGEIMHSTAYKGPEKFKDKRVVVIGVGETASDILDDMAGVTAKAYLSVRRGTFVIPRRFYEGFPNDYHHMRGFHTLPLWFRNMCGHWFIIAIFIFGQFYSLQHLLFGRKDNPRFELFKRLSKKAEGNMFEMFMTKSENLYKPLIDGKAELRPAVQALTEHGVKFVDGSEVEADAVLFCTGYRSVFPFLPGDLGTKPIDGRDLYKLVVHPQLPNLMIIGNLRPNSGAMMPLAELQARYAALVFSGRRQLPPPDELKRIIAEDRAWHIKNFPTVTNRLTAFADFFMYSNDMAELIGCLPLFWKVLAKPRLWFKVFFANIVGMQFRMFGPHAAPEIAEPIVVDVPPCPARPNYAFGTISPIIFRALYTLSGGNKEYKQRTTYS